MISEESVDSRPYIEIPAKSLRSIVGPPVAIAKDGLTNFYWSNDGLRIQTVSPSNSIVINQEVRPPVFYDYNIPYEIGEFVFGTKCKTIHELLKAANREEIVSIEFDTNAQYLTIRFSEVSYTLSGVDPEAPDEPDLPELNHDVVLRANPEVFDMANQVIGMVSESMQFEVTKSQFKISGKGDSDSAEIDAEIKTSRDSLKEAEGDCAAMIESVSTPAVASFGSRLVSHISEFTTPHPLSVFLREDYPLRIETSREQNRIFREIIIAPRMDSTN